MSLLPYLFDDYPLRRPSRLLDQHFGLGLAPSDVLMMASPILSEDYYRPWRSLVAATKDLGSSIKNDADKFEVSLDVQQFSPEEITVKTADGYIVIEGKHEEKKDQHGLVTRHFVRKYALPDNTNFESVESKLSSDGVLTITAPKVVPDAIKGERKVPIASTGPVRKEIKDQREGTDKQVKSKM
ncbi:protein lethal(2)essential for life-like [Aricia agestis]|uniref:protein lethal(2)essential for life-like n=1 Tax=Aricia agestis TaxID=91739 RepID=UPI001C206EBC|nr:protein lethal(2)essential for life-like [Aricia agestis]